MGSPRTTPPRITPAIGIIKIKECNETAPYFWSIVFHATKPKDAVRIPWYKRETRTFRFICPIIVPSHIKPARKKNGIENIMG